MFINCIKYKSIMLTEIEVVHFFFADVHPILKIIKAKINVM